MYGSPFATAKMVLLSVAVTALLGAASLLLVVLPMLSVGGEGLTLFFGLAYPIGDLALLLPAFLSLLVYWAYKLGKAYVGLTIAVVLNVVADSLFSYLTLTETYVTGNSIVTLDDLLFIWGYLAFLWGFHTKWKEF
ncbi:TPA: hypothetical protein EYP44_00340 [Candidatus Bathyarchaeota archaeon]|nr:hypothetical protein [Candidatus Bathyarchaeota archaeon]